MICDSKHNRNRNTCVHSREHVLHKCLVFFVFFIWFLRLLALRPLLAYCASHRVILKMIVEKQMECRLAGETEDLGENLPQRHFCPSQNPT
jgi:hypothetical protein